MRGPIVGLTAGQGLRLHVGAARSSSSAERRARRPALLRDRRARPDAQRQELGELQTVVADSTPSRRARAALPGRRRGARAVAHGERVRRSRFFSQRMRARLLDGPWVGGPVGAISAGRCGWSSPSAAVDRGPEGAVSVISRASLARLAEEAGARRRSTPALPDADRDRRRRRPCGGRLGRPAGPGRARPWWRSHGHVGRCLVTSRDPDSGEIDLPTLELLRRATAGELDSTEPLPFGIYGEVLEPGTVRVGDAVVLRSTGSVPAHEQLIDQPLGRPPQPRTGSGRDRRPRRRRHPDAGRQAQRAGPGDVRRHHRRRGASARRARRAGGRPARRRAELLLGARHREHHGLAAATAPTRCSIRCAASPPTGFSAPPTTGCACRCR